MFFIFQLPYRGAGTDSFLRNTGVSDLGFPVFEAIPIGHGRDVPELFEYLAHITLIGEAYVLGDLCQGQLRVQQQIGGPKDPLFVDGVLQADPGLFFEQPGKIGRADADGLGNVLQVDLFPVVLSNVVPASLHVPGAPGLVQFLRNAPGQLLNGAVSIVKNMGRIRRFIAFVDIIAADAVSGGRGHAGVDGGAGTEGDADNGNVAPVLDIRVGEAAAVTVHVFGDADRVFRPPFPYGLQNQLLFPIAVANPLVIISFVFPQVEVCLLPAELLIDPVTPNWDEVEKHRALLERASRLDLEVTAMSHEWFLPAGCRQKNGHAMPRRDLTPGSLYRRALDMLETSWCTMVSLFPQVKIWEIGNEWNLNAFLHPDGFLASDMTAPFTADEKMDTAVDMMYFAARGVRRGNPNAKVASFSPALSTPGLGGDMPDYLPVMYGVAWTLDKVYSRIKSGKFWSTNTDDYFDLVAWHP